MVRVAELLADLMLLKTIPSTDALALLSPTPITSTTSAATPAPDDADLTRAEEFLTLRAEQVGRDELVKKRDAVERVMREREERRVRKQERDEGWVHDDEEEVAGAIGGWDKSGSGKGAGGRGMGMGRGLGIGRMAGAWGR